MSSPLVISSDPANCEEGVDVHASLVVTFNMVVGGVDEASVVLMSLAGPVPCSRVLFPLANGVTVTPDAALGSDDVYQLELGDGIFNAEDEDEHLVPVAIAFSTETLPVPHATFWPVSGACGVALDAHPTVTFDIPMDADTLSTNIRVDTVPPSGVYFDDMVYDVATRTATITPYQVLDPSAEYLISVNGNVEAADGVPIVPVSSMFTTAVVPATDAKDYEAQAKARLLWQYSESPKLQAWVAAQMQILQDQENTLLALAGLVSIDDATGVNLDIIGELVGQARSFLNDSPVSDAQYRLLIRARIMRNVWTGNAPDWIALATFVLGAGVWLDDSAGGMSFGYGVSRILTADELALLSGDILPRPIGVEVGPREHFDIANFFGFDDQPGALGFDAEDPGDPAGGSFAEDF